MTETTTDVIDELLGIVPGDALDGVRAARPDARTNAQRSFEALFEPVETTHVGLGERYAIAAFVSGLHAVAPVAELYAAGLEEHEPAITDAVRTEIARGSARGPYGVYREPGLAAESVPGPAYRVAEPDALGARLAAALEHAHLLVFRPREARPEDLDRLLAAGWSTTAIVTISQLVAFLAFQTRVVHGLGQLAAAPGSTSDHPEEGSRR